ncbi:MAG: transglutaminase family protein [Alphaproteobacteria bacterium]
MRLAIEHTTAYVYQTPLKSGLQELRLTPKTRAGQTVMRWNIAVEGGAIQARFDDHNNNQIVLISMDEGASEVRVLCEGEVETAENAGVVGRHGGFAPLWYFLRETPLTRPGPAIRKLVRSLGDGDPGDIGRMHALLNAVAEAAEYRVGATAVGSSGEDALAAGAGVCQDHTHIFIAAARLMGHPARYVSGYLLTDAEMVGEASHAWAEAHVDGLGWVGFDASNGISPDQRYVRVATGLDYAEAAPTHGITVGGGEETLSVAVRVTP